MTTRIVPSGVERENLLGLVPADVRDEVKQLVSQREATASAQTMRLWNCMEQSWSSPLPMYQAMVKLNDQVFKCSACTFHDNRVGAVGEHSRQARERAVEHHQATVIDAVAGGRRLFQCSACEVTKERQVDVQRHIEAVHQLGLQHHNVVREQIVKVYALQPSALTVVSEQMVLGTPPLQDAVGLDASTVERSPQRRKRKRHRGHRKVSV